MEVTDSKSQGMHGRRCWLGGLEAYSIGMVVLLILVGVHARGHLRAARGVRSTRESAATAMIRDSAGDHGKAPERGPARSRVRTVHGSNRISQPGPDIVTSNPPAGAHTGLLNSAMLSLPTGTRLMEDQADGGLGKLEAINHIHEDAYIVVVDAKTHRRVRQVYVKAHEAFTMEHLDQGEYQVFFTTGLDWDEANEEFKWAPSYLDFGQRMRFREEVTAEGVVYDHRTITLDAVPEGDGQAAEISKAQFHALAGAPLPPSRPFSSNGIKLPDMRQSTQPTS